MLYLPYQSVYKPFMTLIAADTVEPRKRGRPRRAPEDQASRAALIRVGLVALTERGYAGVRIDEIVAAAGVTKGSFYYHFRSKAAYGAVLIDAYGAYFRDKLARNLERDDLAPLDCLRAFAEDAEAGMARHEFRRGCLIGNLGQEMASLPEDYRARLIAALRSWEQVTAGCLRAAQAQGDLGPRQDPDMLATLFWTGWEGAVLRAKLDRNPQPLRQFCMAFLRLASS